MCPVCQDDLCDQGLLEQGAFVMTTSDVPGSSMNWVPCSQGMLHIPQPSLGEFDSLGPTSIPEIYYLVGRCHCPLKGQLINRKLGDYSQL